MKYKDKKKRMIIPQHAKYRPVIDRICGEEHGNWSEEQIVDHASTFLDNLIKDKRSLRMGADIRVWACIYLYKVWPTPIQSLKMVTK